MAAGEADRQVRGTERYAFRLTAALAAAGLPILAFGAIAYVQVIAPIADDAVRESVTSSFVGLILTATISLALVGVTVGSNTAITLQLLSSKAREMEGGNMDVELSTERDDEIGVLADSLSGMRDALQERIETVQRKQRETEQLNEHIQQKAAHYDAVLKRVTAGDLSQRVDADSEVGPIADIGESINITVAALEETTAEISEQMESLSATSEEVAASAQELVETSDRAARAHTVGSQTRTAAETAMKEMSAVEAETDEAVEQIERLNEEMEEISDIVGLITEIAEKTNILAVNARIEASRSDTSSQGYSVVADEVRELAEETKEAAEEIERRIARLEGQTDETVGDIRETNERLQNAASTVRTAIESLDTVAGLVDDVDANVKNISDATDEQARSVQTVAEQVERLSAIEEVESSEDDDVIETGGIELDLSGAPTPDAGDGEPVAATDGDGGFEFGENERPQNDGGFLGSTRSPAPGEDD